MGADHLVGPDVDDLAFSRVGDDLEEGLGRLDVGAADHPALAGRVARQADLGEEGGCLVILVLRPALEGMIVALVAVESDPQEQLRRVFHGRRRVAEDLEIRRRGILPVRPGGCHDRADELVIGRVAGDLARIQLRKASEPSTPRNLRLTCSRSAHLLVQ